MELARNSLLSLTLHISNRAANALIFIIIGRSAGATEAGIFQLATTYLLIFSVLTRGLDELVIRQIARRPEDARQYFTTFLLLRLLLSALLYGILTCIVSFVLSYPADTLTPILIVSVGVVSDSMAAAANAIWLGQRRFEIPTVIAVGLLAIRIVLGGLLLSLNASLNSIAMLWTLSSILAALVSVLWTNMHVKELPARHVFDLSLLTQEMGAMIPFMVNGFLMAVEFQIDIVLLSVIRSEQDVGWYGAATTIVFTLTMIPQAYRMSVYPLMAHYAVHDRKKLEHLYTISVRYLGTLALPMTAGIVVLSPQITQLIYKSGFLPTVAVLRSLAPALIFVFLNVPNVRMMFVHNRQGRITLLLVGSMLINVTLNLWLTPNLGARGAAQARVYSSLFFFISSYVLMRSVELEFKASLVRLLWRPFLATMLMSGIIMALRDMPLIIVILVGTFVYFGVLLLIGGVPLEDRRAIRDSIKARRQSARV
jgi:O-antigen/teichoic acid export membrane protein